MPFPSFRSNNSISSTPEVTSSGDHQASTDFAAEKDWKSTTPSEPVGQTSSYSPGFEFKFYNPDTGIVYYRPRQPDDEIDPSPARPLTPEQGDRKIPWESYRGLPPDHLVFTYPDEVKNMLYQRGIDPVEKATKDELTLEKAEGKKKGWYQRFQQARDMKMDSVGGKPRYATAGAAAYMPV